MNNFRNAFEKIFEKYSGVTEDGEVSLADLSVSREGNFLNNIPEMFYDLGGSLQVCPEDGVTLSESKKQVAGFLKSNLDLIDENDLRQSHLPPSERHSAYKDVPVVSHNLADAMTHLERAATESLANINVAPQDVEMPLPKLPPIPVPSVPAHEAMSSSSRPLGASNRQGFAQPPSPQRHAASPGTRSLPAPRGGFVVSGAHQSQPPREDGDFAVPTRPPSRLPKRPLPPPNENFLPRSDRAGCPTPSSAFLVPAPPPRPRRAVASSPGASREEFAALHRLAGSRCRGRIVKRSGGERTLDSKSLVALHLRQASPEEATSLEDENIDSVTDILGNQPSDSQVGLPRLPGRVIALSRDPR